MASQLHTETPQILGQATLTAGRFDGSGGKASVDPHLLRVKVYSIVVCFFRELSDSV